MDLYVLLAWIVALVIATAVLGVCAYEIVWKSRRLQRDLAGLHDLDQHIGGLREQLAVTQDRLAAAKFGS